MTAWKDGIPDEFGYDRYGDSPYYSPPEGTEILADYDWAGDYEFSKVVIWRRKETGELRAAYDSGCSCPTPFGDLTWEGMKPIREVDDLRSLVDKAYDVEWDGTDPGVAMLKAKVHKALAGGS